MNKFASIFRKRASIDKLLIDELTRYSKLSSNIHNFTTDPTEENAEEIQSSYNDIVVSLQKIANELESLTNIIFEDDEDDEEKEEYEIKKNEDGSI